MTMNGNSQTGRPTKEHDGPTYYKTLARSGYAPVNGLNMYYEIHGTGKPLVTIHPVWGMANVFPTLTRNRQLIALELQGHGRTADIDRPLSFEQEADDVAALLKHLGIERADFFGESNGGVVAMMMAVRYPELVDRVAIYASPWRFDDAYPEQIVAELMVLSASSDSVKFQRETYERMAAKPSQWPTLFAKARGIEWKGFSPEELKSVKAPVLIAVGDHDMLRLEHCVDMFRLIPQAQLAVIPDAGHFVLNVDPEKLLPTVATFLDQPLSKVPFATPRSGYHPGVTR